MEVANDEFFSVIRIRWLFINVLVMVEPCYLSQPKMVWCLAVINGGKILQVHFKVQLKRQIRMIQKFAQN